MIVGLEPRQIFVCSSWFVCALCGLFLSSRHAVGGNFFHISWLACPVYSKSYVSFVNCLSSSCFVIIKRWLLARRLGLAPYQPVPMFFDSHHDLSSNTCCSSLACQCCLLCSPEIMAFKLSIFLCCGWTSDCLRASRVVKNLDWLLVLALTESTASGTFLCK